MQTHHCPSCGVALGVETKTVLSPLPDRPVQRYPWLRKGGALNADGVKFVEQFLEWWAPLHPGDQKFAEVYADYAKFCKDLEISALSMTSFAYALDGLEIPRRRVPAGSILTMPKKYTVQGTDNFPGRPVTGAQTTRRWSS